MTLDPNSRRHFNQLLIAAFGGALAGSTLGCSGGSHDEAAGKGADSKAADAKTTGNGAPAADKNDATHDEKLLLVGDPHVCRGLNQCKNQGKTKMNDCAGQGACATAEKHSCDGLNSCKGQGGCGQYPGQNQCKGQGACAVTLKDKTWLKARAKFEQVMTENHKKFGPAPAKG
jgi:hypothetical protein